MNRMAAWRVVSALGSGVLFSLLGGQAFAQESDIDREGDEGAPIVVTGSRIQTGMDTPVPVTSVTADELDNLSPGVMVQALTQLPQFYGSNTPSNPGLTISGPGPGALNLRGLGANRTLVLLNGRRLPSTSRYGTADVNTLPETFIKTVDTVTGGASAAYGADAVTGVVNFVLDTDYEGIEANVQGGITERGDNENWKASIAGGFRIGDRGHFLISGEYQHSNPITSFKGRDWYKGTNFVPNYDRVLGPQSPYYLLRDDVVAADSTLDGLIQTFFPPLGIGLNPAFPGGPPAGLISSLNNIEFHPDGSYGPFVFGDPAGLPPPPNFAAQSITNGGSGTDIADDRYGVLPESSRANIFAYGEYELSDNLKVYGQGTYGRSYVDALNPGGGLFVGAWPLQIFSDNAFLPDAIRNTMTAEGLSSVALFRVGSVQDLADTHTIASYDTYAGTFGFDATLPEGGFLSDWNVAGFYQYARTDFKQRQTKVTRTDRYPLAMDAVEDPSNPGNIVCRVTLYSDDYDDCVPFNPFGRGNASPEAVDWVTGYDEGVQIDTPLYYTDTGYDLGLTDSYISTADKVSLGRIEQNMFELTLNGEIFEGFGAGPVMAALGGSYRQETLDQIVRAAGSNPANDPTIFPNPLNEYQPGGIPGVRGSPGAFQASSTDGQFSDAPNVRGKLSVSELFGELLVPLVRDAPFMRQLNLSGAARWADYSKGGGIWAWKAGIDAQFNDTIRLRATASRDIRAPNFSELYEATAGAEGIIYQGVPNTIFFSAGGNPDLKPETSKTYTVGAVITPGGIPGLALSLDWYDIKVSGAIGTLTSQEIINACDAGDEALCDRIIFTSAGGAIERVLRNYLNLNQLHVSGIDVEGSYTSSIKLLGGDESFSTRLFLSWLDSYAITSPTGATASYVGQVGTLGPGGGGGRPEWKATANFTYRNGPFSINLQERYIGSGLQNANPIPNQSDVDFNKVSAILYSDLRLSYKFADDKVELYGTVTNLTDTAPPATPSGNLILLTAYNSSLYDLLGRRYAAGVRVKF